VSTRKPVTKGRPTYRNDLMERAFRGEETERPPIWLMRQAGRTDPEYNAFRERDGRQLDELFRDPDAATFVSLLPRRLGVDAIIYFQDILTPLAPMGCEFVFRPGPVTSAPIRRAEDVNALRPYDVADRLPFRTLGNIQKELDGEMPVLGFAGAPLTLAVFMIEGRSFGASAASTLAFLDEQPDAAGRLLEKLTAMTIDYLTMQIEAGAFAVQLFESAAFLLTSEQYRRWALPYQQQIVDAVNGRAPTIMFAREWDDVTDLDASGADVLSLHSNITIADARALVGRDRVIQGNLDNQLLKNGPREVIETETRAIIESGECRGHVFNLNHGLLRDTPYEHVQFLVNLVRSYRAGDG